MFDFCRSACCCGSVQDVDTTDPETAKAWGQDDGIWIDATRVGTGPALTEAKVRRKIEMRQRGPWWAHLFGR